jgi:hypothetical protein
MMRRCYKLDDPGYHNYGARGIAVAPEWHDVAAFVRYLDDHLGPCPANHTLDRIDNDGNYEPGNIRWATRAVQNQNRRKAPGLYPPRR